jgi:putative aldouronate transport system substrate-binding protein
MNNKKLWTSASCVLLCSALIVSGCGKDTEPTTTASPKTSEAPTTAEKNADPFGKYDTPIEVTTVRAVDATFKYADGDSIDSNVWTKIFEKDYGIKVKNLWTVDLSQYRQKLNVSIASGDLPDFLEVNKEELSRLAEADMLADLTKVYEQYASPYLKNTLQQDNGVGFKAATYDGKVIGIPKHSVNGGVSTAEMIWVRTDWLKKLNLPEPKTMDDVIKIATAFAKQDPDGNGKADTIGFGINKELFQGHGTLVGFMNGYGAYPQIWTKDASGKLINGSVQPEVKASLKQLSDMYKEGVLDKEFAVKPATKLYEDIAAGRLGLAYGNVSDGGFIHKESHTKDPNAQWKAYPIVSATGQPASPQLLDTASNFYVVKKGAKHPEAVVKLVNIYLKLYYETNYSPNPNPYISDPKTGIFPQKYAPVIIDPLNANLEAFGLVQAALKAGDGSKLGFPASVHFDRLSKFKAGDDTMWFSNVVWGSEGSFSVIDFYNKNKLGKYNDFVGAATPTMAEKISTLKKMQDTTFTKIIMGEVPVDEFDKFVADWKRQGGDAIEKEVNDWYNKNK